MIQLHNSTFVDPGLDSTLFLPTPRAVRINSFLFASLCCSLFAAFGAILAQQWLAYFDRESHLSSLPEQGRERQNKYIGLKWWRVETLIETLPTILQFSLFFFFVAIIDFFWNINHTIAFVILGFAFSTFILYVGTTLIAIFAQGSPYQTRFSALLRFLLLPKNYFHIQGGHDILGGECIKWLLETSSNANAMNAAAEAVTTLSNQVRTQVQLGIGFTVRSLLKPSVIRGQVVLCISIEALRSSLVVLQALVAGWDREAEPVLQLETEDELLVVSLRRELLRITRTLITDTKTEAVHALVHIFKKLGFGEQQSPSDIQLLYQRLTDLMPILDETSTHLYQNVVVTILTDEQGLNASEMERLLDLDDGTLAAHLGMAESLFIGISPRQGSIHFQHKIIANMLTGSSLCRNLQLRVNLEDPEIHSRLAVQCFDVMARLLRKDICNVIEPFKFNSEIEDLQMRLEANVPYHLRYACRYWSTHLKHCSNTRDIRNLFETFLKTNFLHWLEVLSLLGWIEGAQSQLVLAEEWLKVSL